MASINELINLSRYQAGDFGREGLNGKGADFSGAIDNIKTTNQQQAESINLQMLAAKLAQAQQEAAIAKKQKELWDGIGVQTNNNKTTSGVVGEMVDSEDAALKRDATSAYEAKLSPRGNMVLSKTKQESPIKYDRVKVVNRAMKLVNADLLEAGIDKADLTASDYQMRLKNAIPQAEEYLNMSGLGPKPKPVEESIGDINAPQLQFDESVKNPIVPQAVGPLDIRRLSKDFAYFPETKQEKAGKKPDSYGFHIGQIQQSSKGRVRYIGNNKWQKVD